MYMHSLLMRFKIFAKRKSDNEKNIIFMLS